MDRLFFLAAAIVIAGLLSGGIYSATGTGNGFGLVVNRFTGTVWTCNFTSCTVAERSPGVLN